MTKVRTKVKMPPNASSACYKGADHWHKVHTLLAVTRVSLARVKGITGAWATVITARAVWA